MKKSNSFHSINIRVRLRSLLFLFLILFMTAIPVVNVVFHILDVHYELCEIYEDNDVKEKEMRVFEDEFEDQDFYFFLNLYSFYFNRCSSDFNPDVPQPPPKESLNSGIS